MTKNNNDADELHIKRLRTDETVINNEIHKILLILKGTRLLVVVRVIVQRTKRQIM